MNELHFAWIEFAILLPLFGALLVSRLKNPGTRQTAALLVGALTLVAALGDFEDFYMLHIHQAASDRWRLMTRIFGRELFVVDELSAPLVPLVALLYLLTNLATLRTKLPRVSFGRLLLSESLTIALFSSVDPWMIIALMSAGALLPYLELRSRNQPTGVYVLHMGAFVALMVLGWSLLDGKPPGSQPLIGLIPLMLGIAIRCGVFPFHLWISDLFENSSFATSLLTCTPLAGAYALVRLVIPTASHDLLAVLRIVAVFTAIYSSGMAMVQRDVRRFIACLFTSHSSLVLAGLALATPHSTTGALCLWFSIILATGGFGLTLRSLEARYGRLQLTKYLGLYVQSPALAICFVITGLASVGFPGTLGFIATDLLVDGAISANPIIGALVAVVEALNGIAMLRAYFLLFTGTRHMSTVSLQVRPRERLAVLTLAALILGGGIYPQPGVVSRHDAADVILSEREKNVGPDPRESTPEAEVGAAERTRTSPQSASASAADRR
ncbi:MAG: oxidoreductase [Planctomycetaceae bacterium]|nr:oxidoreductase [Planctomycetaceae bacterium]